MKLTVFTAACLSAVLLDTTIAHPGMSTVVNDIKARILERQGGAADPALNSNELIGDLLTLQDSELSPVAKDIKDTILSQAGGENLATYSNVPQLGTTACAADTCVSQSSIPLCGGFFYVFSEVKESTVLINSFIVCLAVHRQRHGSGVQRAFRSLHQRCTRRCPSGVP